MMLTRCPACQTVFRLQPEQLHARRGEVRCGHCFHPFNALENEVATPAGREPTRSTAKPAAPVAATPEVTPAQTDTSLDFEIPEGPDLADGAAASMADLGDAFGDESALPEGPIEVLPEVMPESRPQDTGPARPESAKSAPEVVRSGRRTPAPAAVPPPGPTGSGDEQRDEDEHAAAPAPSPAGAEAEKDETNDDEGAATAQQADTVRDEAGESAAAADAPPDTVREPLISAWAQKQTALTPAPRVEKTDAPAQPKPAAAHIPREVDVERLDSVYGPPPKPANPLLRTLGGLALGLLAGTLAAQAIYLFRVEIGRELPGLRPLLVAACAELGCDVPLPRQAEHIGIDATELQSEPGRSGRYTLHMTLKNRAAYPIEWPHLELTLTDGGDTPLARRVLTPQEWVPLERRRSGFSARDTLSVRLPFENSGPSPTGYRVYVFYP